jgi:O-antigen ligase
LSIYSVNSFADLRKFLWAFIVGVILLAFFTITAEGTGRLTASGTYDPNDIAMLFVISIPLIYFFIVKQKGLAKLILFGSLLTVLFAFILTVSRGGFVGIIAIATLIFFMDKYRSWAAKIMVMAVLAVAFVQFAPDAYWERIKTISDQTDYNIQSEYGRKTIWLRGLGLMMENPVTGVGAGAFTTAMGHTYGQDVSGFRWQTAHNAFIQIGAELGVAGLVLFIVLILSSILSLRRLRAKYAQRPGVFQEHLWLTTALQISLVGYVATAMFLSAYHFPMFYFLIALCCILRKMEMMEDLQPEIEGDCQEHRACKIKDFAAGSLSQS